MLKCWHVAAPDMMMSSYDLVEKLFLTFLLVSIWIRTPLPAVLGYARRYIKHCEQYLIFTKCLLVSHGASNCERSKNRFSFLIIFFSENHSFLKINTALRVMCLGIHSGRFMGRGRWHDCFVCRSFTWTSQWCCLRKVKALLVVGIWLSLIDGVYFQRKIKSMRLEFNLHMGN